MYCKNCGKQIDDNAAICVNCGTLTDKKNIGGSGSSYRNEFFAPFSGLIISCFGIFFSLIAIAGLLVSVSQFKRAKSIYGETKYALAGIVTASVIIGFMILGIVVLMEELALSGSLGVI